jgi:hypothetical protein
MMVLVRITLGILAVAWIVLILASAILSQFVLWQVEFHSHSLGSGVFGPVYVHYPYTGAPSFKSDRVPVPFTWSNFVQPPKIIHILGPTTIIMLPWWLVLLLALVAVAGVWVMTRRRVASVAFPIDPALGRQDTFNP